MKHPRLTAEKYHQVTSYRRYHLTPHTLNWAHQPQLIKPYPERPSVSLERNPKLPEIDYSTLVKRGNLERDTHKQLTVQWLSTIIKLTHAITASSRPAGRAFFYRSAASAGALYPFELYLAAHHIEGLEAGVYHHHLFENSLTPLRRNPVAVFPPMDRGVSATVYITGIFFRSAWKYRSRAYRYVLLDAGHLLENLRLALGAMNIAFSIHLNFNDEHATTLLGLNPDQEACLLCVHIYDGANETSDGNQDMAPLEAGIIQASTVSDKEVTYEDILDVHRSGGATESRMPDAILNPKVLGDPPESWIDLKPSEHSVKADYKAVLWQRRSRRNFIDQPVPANSFMAFMDQMAHTMGDASGMPAMCRSAIVTGFLVGDGMPVPKGFYVLDTEKQRLGLVRTQELMAPMAEACLDQMWLKHAGLHLLLMADVKALDQTWGTRGYRYAMIEAGRLGQQAYLSATAVGWGACGIGAIYDWEAAELLNLSPNAALLYLVGVGPVKKR